MARLVVGGKNGDEIRFSGDKQRLPPHIRRIINQYFSFSYALSDYSAYPSLLAELGDARADRFFAGTDWEALQKAYDAHMQRFVVLFSGGKKRGLEGPQAVRFLVTAPAHEAARPLQALLREYCVDGALRDNFDVWRLEKLLRRAKGQLRFDKGFTLALKTFGAMAVSLEESISFFRQIQAYHAEQFLRPELHSILAAYIDQVHTLRQPLDCSELVAKLHVAGAQVRIHASVKPVLEHYERLKALAEEIEPPLSARLYPFQREGVAFLVANRRALLADDMGLGKTLQSMTAALYLKQQRGLKRTLIVCPASLKYQWQSEIQRFTGERCEVIGGGPEERESIYRAAGVFDRAMADAPAGAARGRSKSGARQQADELLDELLTKRPGAATSGRPQALPGIFHDPADMPFFYIVNYELVHRDIAQLKALAPDILILDEAQRVKNFRTKTAQSVFSISSPYLFVLTGTPLENQLMELYTIMKFIEPQALGANPLAFRDRYVILDRFGGIQGYQKVEEVSRKIAALTLRRTKTQTLTELPPLIEMERWLSLTEIQRAFYKDLQGETSMLLSKEQWDKLATSNAMTLLQRLREVCDTPELIEPSQRESQKLTELHAILEDEIRTLDRQAIIFTQWTRMGEILLRELTGAGYSPAFLHGGVDARGRSELVEAFQAGKSRILISTDAGGTGLNLQAASLVVNYDLPFNPAKLAQRVARAHRMGQQGSVVVINLLCRNTVEEKLLKLLKEKQGLFDDVFGDISDPSQVKPSAQLSLRELLKELVS